MGRIRTIKPEILEDERSAALSSDAWRLWVSTWLLADDYGNVRAEPRRLCASVFWGLNKPPNMNTLLDELENAGLIRRYEVDGQQYLTVPKWSKHQRIDNAGKSTVPAPTAEALAAIRGEMRRVAAGLGKEGKGKEEEKEGEDAATPRMPGGPFDFEAIWQAYPRKLGKKKGLQRCRSQVIARPKYDALVMAVGNYAAEVADTDEKYIKRFDTFMNGDWEDYVERPARGNPRRNGHARQLGLIEPMPAQSETKAVPL